MYSSSFIYIEHQRLQKTVLLEKPKGIFQSAEKSLRWAMGRQDPDLEINLKLQICYLCAKWHVIHVTIFVLLHDFEKNVTISFNTEHHKIITFITMLFNNYSYLIFNQGILRGNPLHWPSWGHVWSRVIDPLNAFVTKPDKQAWVAFPAWTKSRAQKVIPWWITQIW